MNILEDNCESMGAEFAGMKNREFRVMSSHSTFFSHHMQTMEGGIITTDDEYYYQMLLCLRSHAGHGIYRKTTCSPLNRQLMISCSQVITSDPLK